MDIGKNLIGICLSFFFPEFHVLDQGQESLVLILYMEVILLEEPAIYLTGAEHEF